jgi:hypothetical protein
MNNNELYLALSDPFPVEMERTVNKSGRALTYLPIAEVINKMNKVIGIGNWSSEVVSIGRDALDPDWVIAHVRVSITVPSNQTNEKVHATYDGVGGQAVKRKKTGEILDLGDEFKGAVSDALKKAPTTQSMPMRRTKPRSHRLLKSLPNRLLRKRTRTRCGMLLTNTSPPWTRVRRPHLENGGRTPTRASRSQSVVAQPQRRNSKPVSPRSSGSNLAQQRRKTEPWRRCPRGSRRRPFQHGFSVR